MCPIYWFFGHFPITLSSLLVAPRSTARAFFFLSCLQVSCDAALSVHSLFFHLCCLCFFFILFSPFLSFFLLFSISGLSFVFLFMLKYLKLTFLFLAIILRFWFFLLSFCFVDFGFYCGDFVSSMYVVFGKECCLFLLFWFCLLRFCSVHALCVLHKLLFQYGFGI